MLWVINTFSRDIIAEVEASDLVQALTLAAKKYDYESFAQMCQDLGYDGRTDFQVTCIQTQEGYSPASDWAAHRAAEKASKLFKSMANQAGINAFKWLRRKAKAG